MNTSLAPPPVENKPVRHGTARLRAVINGSEYRLKRQHVGDSPYLRGCRIWTIGKLDGPRLGAVYAVARHRGVNTCTCPDSTKNRAACKHIRALGRPRPAQRSPRPQRGGQWMKIRTLANVFI